MADVPFNDSTKEAGPRTTALPRRLTEHAIEFEDLAPASSKDLPLFRGVGERAVESRFDATRGASLSQFVGRKSEIDTLLDRCAQEHKRGERG